MQRGNDAKSIDGPTWLRVAAIVAATFVVHAPALRGSWLWDDRVDLPDNPHLRTLSGLWNIWAHPTLLYDFYPLKHSVQWVQWQLWGEHTLGYHLTNVALHATSALLFWRVLRQLGLRLAWAGGLIFAVHPLTVESVAWIAELKNTLSLPPLLLATSAFIDWVRHGRRGAYVGALAWFVVAMLCKTSVVMFPCTLLLLAWWLRGTLRRDDVLAAAPFFGVSLLLGLVTVWFQTHRAIAGEHIEIGGLLARSALVGTTAWFYLGKALWPAGLLPIYSRWPVTPLAFWHAAAWLALAGAAVAIWRCRDGWGRHAALGLGWFALHIAPFTGVLTISFMRFTWVMDHFAYVPMLGVIGLGVGALGMIPTPRVATAAVVVLAGSLLWQARGHAEIFRDERTLWGYTVARDPAAWLAHYNLGAALNREGESAQARTHYEAALRLKPDYAEVRSNLGVLLSEQGDFAGGIAQLRQAIQLDPTYAEGHNNLGFALLNAGRIEEALPLLHRATLLKGDFTDAHLNLGSALRRAGRTSEAIAQYQIVLGLKPGSHEVWFNLGNAQRDLGQIRESVASYERAIALKPGLAVAHRNLAISLRDLGRAAEARVRYAEALRLNPAFPPWPD